MQSAIGGTSAGVDMFVVQAEPAGNLLAVTPAGHMAEPCVFESLALVPMSCLGAGFAQFGYFDPSMHQAKQELPDYTLALWTGLCYPVPISHAMDRYLRASYWLLPTSEKDDDKHRN